MSSKRSFLASLKYGWRQARCGMCFLTFMLSGLLLAILVLPLIRIMPVSKRRKARWSLGLVNLAFFVFIRYTIFWGLMAKFRLIGSQHIKKSEPCLYIANHPSLVDVVAIMGSVPYCNCIVKEALFKNRFMGGVLRQAGLIPNDSGLNLLDLIQQEIQDGHPLVIFPEGTRSPEGGLNPFNRGAAQIAVRTGLPVAPILVTCNPNAMMKGQKWYQPPAVPVTFTLEFFPAFQWPAEISEDIPTPLKVRRMNRLFENFYREKLGISESAEVSEG